MTSKNKKLRSLIYGIYDSEAQFAKSLGWTKQKLNKITNGTKDPDVYEVAELANGLNESIENMVKIFLPAESPFWQPVNAN